MPSVNTGIRAGPWHNRGILRINSCKLWQWGAVGLSGEKSYDEAANKTVYNRTPWGVTMSIKSDKWMRRMVEQYGMIDPFEPNQVRYDSQGQRIVSYGTSSYGYDVRCADEFKIFTNVHSTVVDPKNFDEKSFVDIKSDVCIIPPNSFALRSEEHTSELQSREN